MIRRRQARGGCPVASFSFPGSSRLFNLLAALSLSMGLRDGGLHRWLLRGAALGLTLTCCKSRRRVAFARGLLCTSHETQWLPPNVVRKNSLTLSQRLLLLYRPRSRNPTIPPINVRRRGLSKHARARNYNFS